MIISKAGAMNFILYIKCTEQQDFNYSNPFYEKLRTEIPSIDSLDLDNFSESDLIENACKALELSDRASIVFQLAPKADTGRFLRLATLLADNPTKYRVFIKGKDLLLSKLLFPQDDFCWYDLPETEQTFKIKKFLFQ